MLIRPLAVEDLPALQRLAGVAVAEGFRFLARFVADATARPTSLNQAREFFLGVIDNGDLVAVGGVTPDPYLDDSSTGRLRHLFVHPTARRRGVGRTLVRSLETQAAVVYRRLRLRTDTETAARFYEQLGYERTQELHATHARRLAVIVEAAT